jgi:glucokinase
VKCRPDRLLADIGGTNARFALASTDDPEPREIAVLATSDYPDIGSAVGSYLSLVRAEMPSRMYAAFAGPVNAETVQLTNNRWSFHRGELQAKLALEQLTLINDFEAMAWGVTGIGAGERIQLGGRQPDSSDQPVAVIGPGTGFGTALLLSCGQECQVVATEGGHASLAPGNELELRVTARLLEQGVFCSREALLSGAGLERLYRAISAIRGQEECLSAPRIQQRAVANQDAAAREALALFCALLGTAAADQALCSGARGGVYIVGGIVPRFVPFLQASGFRQRFDSEQRAMHDYLRAIPVYVVTAGNLGLRGAAIAASRHDFQQT